MRTVLTPDPEPVFTPDSSLAGAGGRFTFRLLANAPGTSPLRLVYRRPWEKEVPPLQYFDLAVTVFPARCVTCEGSTSKKTGNDK